MTTTSEILTAAETLDRMHKQFSGLLAAANVLRDLGALENRFAEVKRGLADSQGILSAEHAKLAEARVALGQATDERAKILKDAAEEAAQVVGDAHFEAGHAREAAKKSAAECLLLAQAEAARIVEDAARIKTQAETLGREAKAELAGVQRDIATAKAELKGIEDKISRAKSEAARIAAGG